MGFSVLELRQGDSFDQTNVYKDPNGTAINLTGYTFEFHLSFNGGHTYTAAPEVQNSGTPTDGKLLLHLSAAQTDAFTVNHGFYYLRVTSPGGAVSTLLSGDCYVDR